jgi:hypothetical protein
MMENCTDEEIEAAKPLGTLETVALVALRVGRG